ncbi:MAG: hypothetical protein ACRC37_07735, partial [Lentisphaeria bacterium]
MYELDATSSAIWSLMIDANIATQDQLESIYNEHIETGKPFREVLLNFEIIEEDELLHMLADQIGTEYIQLENFDILPEIISKISGISARMYGIIPVREEFGTLQVAAKDVMDFRMVDELNYVTGAVCQLVVAKPSEIDKALLKYYPEEDDNFDAMLSQLTEDDIID